MEYHANHANGIAQPPSALYPAAKACHVHTVRSVPYLADDCILICTGAGRRHLRSIQQHSRYSDTRAFAVSADAVWINSLPTELTLTCFGRRIDSFKSRLRWKVGGFRSLLNRPKLTKMQFRTSPYTTLNLIVY